MRRDDLQDHAEYEHRAARHDRPSASEPRRYERDSQSGEKSSDVLQRYHDGADRRFVGVAEIILVGLKGEYAA
jgi:hypothetical protein